MFSESHLPEPRKSQRHDEAEARRAQILTHAILLIGQKGYRGLTIGQLAKQCGLTKGGVLYHFSSKENVLIAVADECTWRDSEAIAQLIPDNLRLTGRNNESRDAVKQILRVILGYSSSNPELARLLAMLQIEAIDPDYPAHQQLKMANKIALERYVRLLATISDDPLSLARRVAALMSGLTQQWLSEDREFNLSAEWDRAIADVIPDEIINTPKNAVTI